MSLKENVETLMRPDKEIRIQFLDIMSKSLIEYDKNISRELNLRDFEQAYKINHKFKGTVKMFVTDHFWNIHNRCQELIEQKAADEDINKFLSGLKEDLKVGHDEIEQLKLYFSSL